MTTDSNVKLDIKTLRDQIPAHCFRPSTLYSLFWVFRDSAVLAGLLYGAFWVDNNSNPYVSALTRYVLYPYAAGIAMTGLWVLAHEAGHGAFSTNKTVADTVGFIIHSALMSPYFAWRSSHARHHQFANNVSIDLNYGTYCRLSGDYLILILFVLPHLPQEQYTLPISIQLPLGRHYSTNK